MSREGSVKQGASGTWSFNLDLSPAGAVQRKQVHRRGFRTKKAALAAMQELQHSAAHGSYIAPSKQSTEAFVLEWLETITPTVRPSTWASYERNLRVHVIPRIGSIPLQAVDPGDISRMYAALLDNGNRSRGGGLAPRTVAYIGTILHRAFKDAVRWGRLLRNPCDAVDRPRTPSASSTVVAWDAAALSKFVEESRNYRGKGGNPDRYFALWYLLATTGMRRGEALGLRWSDVDLDAGVASIKQTVIVVTHRVQFGTPKTAMSARGVDLDAGTIVALREHRRGQLAERLLMGAGYDDLGLVFAAPDGSPYHPERISREFDRRVEKWALPKLTVHGLRHTWATLALRGGVHPKVVQERLGHATIGITLGTYSHVQAGMQREAAETVAGLIFGSGH